MRSTETALSKAHRRLTVAGATGEILPTEAGLYVVGRYLSSRSKGEMVL